MEKRTVEQTKVYALVGNDMRGRVEEREIFVVSLDKEKILQYEKGNSEEWVDKNESGEEDYVGEVHSYRKSYKKGSLLEWSNPPVELIEEWHNDDDGSIEELMTYKHFIK